MDLIIPSEGLLFWTTIVFVILLVLLRKFAWKPILGAVQTREGNIQKALDSAKDAEEKMNALTAQNEDLLKQAREERNVILRPLSQDQTITISQDQIREKTQLGSAMPTGLTASLSKQHLADLIRYLSDKGRN